MMPDPRFFKTGPSLSVESIYTACLEADGEARIVGAEGGRVTHAAGVEDSDLTDAVIFCQHKDAARKIRGRSFGLCFASPALADDLSAGGPVIAHRSAKLAFARVAASLHAPLEDEGNLAAPLIGASAQIHESAIVADGAEIGAGVVIGPNSVIGAGVVIGDNGRIGPNVSISFALIGARVRIAAGVVIGEAGFGFVEGPAGPEPAPQLGRVVIEDDVEIGANTTIDRGALQDTEIGAGTKIDNLVQIGHNVRIGRFCLLAAQTGLSGSVEFGEGVMVGGQVGVADGVTIGAGARIAAQSGVIRDIPAGETWGGTPAMPGKTWLRASAAALRQSKLKAGDK